MLGDKCYVITCHAKACMYSCICATLPHVAVAEYTLLSLVHVHEFRTRTSEAMLLAVARETTCAEDSVRGNSFLDTYVVLVLREKYISYTYERYIVSL